MTSKELFLQSTALTEKPGIYLIYCLINEKCYIGSSINVKRRERQHRSDLKKKIHHCANLQNAWNKYGKENFIWRFIKETESLDHQYLVDLENKYLELLSKKEVFNSTIPAVLWAPISDLKGEKHHRSKVTREIAKQIKEEYNSIVKPGKLVYGIRQKLAAKYNLSVGLIGNICTGQHWTNPDYVWRNAFSGAEKSVKGIKKQRRGVSEKILISKEACNAIYDEWLQERKEKLGTKMYVKGLTTRLSKKFELSVDSIRKIVSGEHPNSPIHNQKTEYKIDGYNPGVDSVLKEKIINRYEEIRRERNLIKVPGIKEQLVKEFGVTIQLVINILLKYKSPYNIKKT